MRWFEPSAHSSSCGWKGLASYYDVVVNGERNTNAAWFYADPKQAAENTRGRVAFWHGVKVENDTAPPGLIERLRSR